MRFGHDYSVKWKQTKQLAGNPVRSSTTCWLTRITQTAGQCGGRPCIRGMRIRVTDN
ncbi:MAG: DUF433 domain-containing protein [Microcoleus sp. PH2017_10_PVI_O_A]|nr:DUF433 domain-containing protein [Microcoleus sp. PH2017_10_PVI_O_A]MCC3459222.1 DUF433 domain-containing protein [Microcoleus sp. PH2017_11_PCY_U_A]MCC3477462.1 DUF433 domain-containing protein [Microcoleus sp. PH2017_12_PCY_D_A]MCC3528676.1 DUF433 domain-containing protein [Microcoleus sp. PH2017_21_RUC_O_A]MCC3540839.1 DUF433 domain-containing protein [Microcoleus sp. PH2017_22_RUC_O_B]MCC3558555.1 DUF433 domain-containing protein [Microcoleus sp. PH2017_27_LUM_O_A]